MLRSFIIAALQSVSILLINCSTIDWSHLTKSIAIGLKLFGKSYSGLEYDYRGLLHVYNKLDQFDKILEYTETLNHWKELRDKHAQSEDSPIDIQKHPQPITNIIHMFFSM